MDKVYYPTIQLEQYLNIRKAVMILNSSENYATAS